jgi:membrane protease YdiL (CAAX protease family)
MVVSLSFGFAWLRLRSGSVWPAAILHASHNLWVQGFFDRVTVDTGPTRWFVSEFGAALVVTLGITGWLFWRARRDLPAVGELSASAASVAAPEVAAASR